MQLANYNMCLKKASYAVGMKTSSSLINISEDSRPVHAY